MPTGQKGFSFETYPDLNRNLDESYARNVTEGVAEPMSAHEQSNGLAETVQGDLQQKPNVLGEEIRSWAIDEMERTLSELSIYDLGMELPETIELADHLSDTLTRLYAAKESLDGSTEVAPDGTPIGETMHLTVVPWRFFLNHIDDLDEAIKPLRAEQGKATSDDYFDDALLTAISDDAPIYRIDEKTGVSGYVSPRTYLERKIAEQGDFGVILVQTSNDAGIKSLIDGPDERRSPDAITGGGTMGMEIAGEFVGGMGIFEWLSLTLQNDPRSLSANDFSWMLANRVEVDEGDGQTTTYVPDGNWGGSQVRSSLGQADDSGSDARPRPAVV